MTDRHRLIEAALGDLHRDTPQTLQAGAPAWHALAAVAAAPRDPALAAAHVAAADAPWERSGALQATALLAIHHAATGEPGASLAESYPALVERRRAMATDERGLPAGDIAACALVVRADRDLAEIALALGHNPEPFEAWAQALAGAVNAHLWDDAAGTYGGDPLRGATALFASIPDRARSEQVARALGRDSGARSAVADHELPEHLLVSSLALEGLRIYGFSAEVAALEGRVAAAAARGMASEHPEARRAAAIAAVLAFGR